MEIWEGTARPSGGAPANCSGGYGPPGGGGYGPPGGGGYGPPGAPPGGPPGGGGYGPPGAPPGGYGGPPWSPPPGGPYYGPGGFTPPPTPPGAPGEWSPTEAVSFAWNAVIKNFAGVALPIAVAVFIGSLPSLLMSGVQTALESLVGGSEAATVSMILAPVSSLVTLVVFSFILGGVVQFALKVLRGGRPAFGEVFSGARFFVPVLIVQLLLSFATTVGLLLCVVPGVIVALGCQFGVHLVVERGFTPVDALKESWRLTQGHKLNLFVLALLLFLVFVAGLLACCVGALLVSTPIAVLSAAYVYLRLTGETPQAAT